MRGWLSSLVLVVGCYDPSYGPCAVTCDPGEMCPGGHTCPASGHCDEPMPGACTDAPVPRHIANAYFTNWSGATFQSPGMMHGGFEIPTDGIVDGDLVLFIANIDNGGPTVWPDPIAPGFQQLVQQFYGADGQTYVVAWKIAGGEPATYSGTYGGGIMSASATISLVAVSGAGGAGGF
jgi:hypothetical protein